jgi:hypothetical protein
MKILNYDLYSDISELIASTPEPTKSAYLQLLDLREDHQENSPLRRVIAEGQSSLA